MLEQANGQPRDRVTPTHRLDEQDDRKHNKSDDSPVCDCYSCDGDSDNDSEACAGLEE